MIIRHIAGIEDAEQCYLMGKEMHDESGFRDLDFDKDSIMHYAFLSMQPESDLYVSICALDSGERIGFMFGGINSFYFSPNQKLAQDYAIYIRKPHRSTINARGAVLMIKDFERWAMKKKADRIQLGITTHIDEEKVMRLYRKLGYKSLGQLFYREVM